MAQAGSRPPLSWLGRTRDFNTPDVQIAAAEEGINAREQPTGEATETSDRNFKKSDEYDGVLGGWPEFSHQQHYQHNGSNHHRYGPLHERLILDHETRIFDLLSDLQNLDKIDAKSNPIIIRGLPSQQSLTTDEATLGRLTRRRTIMEELHDVAPKYWNLLLLENRLRELTRISRLEHKDYVRRIEQNDILDKGTRAFFYDVDGFITTRPERAHESFQWLVYEDNWLYRFFRNTFLSKTSVDGRKYLSKDRLRMIDISVIVGLTLGLLLSPMLILFLAPLEKWQSALVVVFFGLVSATGMSSLHRIKSDTVFIAMSAYMAVLVTFLANLQGGQCQCG